MPVRLAGDQAGDAPRRSDDRGGAMAKQRNLSDAEIAIVKAMLRKGWRNDVIHFYFNKPDRLISSGRITQIKKGKYGASVEEAPPGQT
jgi:hypothetical protein